MPVSSGNFSLIFSEDTLKRWMERKEEGREEGERERLRERERERMRMHILGTVIKAKDRAAMSFGRMRTGVCCRHAHQGEPIPLAG
jgi:hypothetical protein